MNYDSHREPGLLFEGASESLHLLLPFRDSPHLSTFNIAAFLPSDLHLVIFPAPKHSKNYAPRFRRAAF
jgi:hypothetical protein